VVGCDGGRSIVRDAAGLVLRRAGLDVLHGLAEHLWINRR